MKTFRNLFIKLLFIIFLNGYAQILAQNQLPEEVSIFQLDNGVKVMLIENKALPMIGINTAVKVGSVYENYATSGMSHMLEHLLFNGTEKFTQRELYDATDLIGGYNNANTSEFYTNFMMVTPTENIEKGIEIQTQMLFHSILPKENFKKEKGIVLEEITKSLAEADEQLERNIISVIYEGLSNSFPTLGTYQTIEHMQRDDVYNFYKKYYIPNNMLVSVVGNFNSKEMLKMIDKYFGQIAPKEIQESDFSEVKDYFPKSDKKYRFYDGENEDVRLFYQLSASFNYELSTLLETQLPKLNDELKNFLKKSNNIELSAKTFLRTKPAVSYLEIMLPISESNLANSLIDSISTFLENYIFSIQEDELAKIITKERTAFLMNIEKPHMFGIYNADIIANEGFEAVLRKFNGNSFKNASFELGRIITISKPILLIQKPKVSQTAEKQDSSNSEIKTSQIPQKSGNAQIIVRQNPQSNLLAIHILLKHKTEYENRFGENAAFVWHEAFKEHLKSEEFSNEIAKNGIVLTSNDNPFIPMDDIYLSDDFGYIRIESLGDNIPEVVNFMNKNILDFEPTEEEFNSAVMSFQRGQMMKKTNPAQTMFSLILDKTLYNSKIEKVKSPLLFDTIKGFGKRYFIPQNMIISVVSKLPTEEIEKLYSDFKKSVPKDFNSNPIEKVTFRENQTPIETVEKVKSPRAFLYYGFIKQIEESEKSAILALSLILQDKITFDIREKQGLAYNMGVGIELRENSAMFYINMGSQNKNVEILTKQFPEKFTRKYLGEITQEELTKRINMYLGKMMFRRLSSINQGFYLGESFYYQNDFEFDSKVLENLKKVTLAEVQKVADKYLSPANEIKIVVKGEE